MRVRACALLLVAATMAWGCPNKSVVDESGRQDLTPSSGPAAQYKIELVFQGLATVSRKDGNTWVFLGNTTDVDQLKFSRDPKDDGSKQIAQHEARLLFPSAPADGVTITAPPTARPDATMCPPESDLESSMGTAWSAVPIFGQHLTLAGTLSPAADTFRGGAKGSTPCAPGADGCQATTPLETQKEDFRWVRNLSEAMTLAGGSGAFRGDLYKPAFAPQGYPLLAARFMLDKGVVKSSVLAEANHEFTKYRIDEIQGWGERAIARRVMVELDAMGPVTIRGRDLANARASAETLLTIDSTGPTVRVVVGNDAVGHPHCHGADNDWVMSYNYLASQPPQVGQRDISAAPKQKTSGGPLPDGSCSPDGGGP